METSNLFAFVQEMDRDDIFIEDEPDHSHQDMVFNSLFPEYEKVVVKSLISSFGLDFLLITDRRGGDVDTINTVRDPSVLDYADKKNAEAYENRGEYNPDDHHKHKNYIERNREVSKQKKEGILKDEYTGQSLPPNAKVDLDHTISAKEIHDDPGRVLAEIKGEDLSTKNTNLNPTDSSINRSKKDYTATKFIKINDLKKIERQKRIKELKMKNDLTDKEKSELNKLSKYELIDNKKVKAKDKKARCAYNQEINIKYYTSMKFFKSTTKASLVKGCKMGIRQALGLILAEVWFTVREEFPKVQEKNGSNFELAVFLKDICEIVKKAFNKAMNKYKEIIATIENGALGGILASISSTLINIFFTTAKFAGKILRESWASLVEAVKILIFNPDDLPFGEVLKAASKIIATSIAVICGSLLDEAISRIIVGIPIISEVLPAFIGSMATGILTVSMLYFLDNSKLVKKIVDYANSLKDKFDLTLDYYKKATEELTMYVSQLAEVDYEKLKEEVACLKNINLRLYSADTILELNETLHEIIKESELYLPYETLEGLDVFMNDDNTLLVI